jgi:hypothetical protein
MEKNELPNGANLLAGIRKFLIPFYLIATIVYLGFSLHYFTTGLGGTMLLAVTLVPLAYVLWVLQSFVAGKLPYPRLGVKLNIAIACAYIAMCIFSIIYMRVEFDALIYDRAGFFNTPGDDAGSRSRIYQTGTWTTLLSHSVSHVIFRLRVDFSGYTRSSRGLLDKSHHIFFD